MTYKNINVVLDCSQGFNGCQFSYQILDFKVNVASESGISDTSKEVYLQNQPNIILIAVNADTLQNIKAYNFGDVIKRKTNTQ